MRVRHNVLVSVMWMIVLTLSLMAEAQVNLLPNTVIVTDDLNTAQNLINSYDQDAPDDRSLVLHWNFGDAAFVDVHVYIEDLENDQHIYLGRTADGSVTSFEWRAGNPHLNPLYADGPQFGESYRFIVFGLVDADTERRWIYTFDPVEFLNYESPTPTPIPSISVPEMFGLMAVTDNLFSSENLIKRWDQDEENDRELVIHWADLKTIWPRSEFNIAEHHIYVRDIETNQLEFLGRNPDVKQRYFVWRAGNRFLQPKFRDGPQFGKTYDFNVFRINADGSFAPYESLHSRHPVIYLSYNDPAPTNTPTQTFTPTNTPKPTFTPSPTFTPLPEGIEPRYEITLNLPDLPETVTPLQLIWIEQNNENGGYFMGKYEITNAQFTAFLNANGNISPESVVYFDEVPMIAAGLDRSYDDIRIDNINGEWTVESGFENHPVIAVTWYGAEDFSRWVSSFSHSLFVRMPDRFEWIYSAQAGTSQTQYWGDDPSCIHANLRDFSATFNTLLCDDGFAKTSPVGSYRPNPFGLHDMLGNVWEYNSLFPFESEELLFRPQSFEEVVIRGGSWFNPPGIAENTGNFYPERGSDIIGFRVAASINPDFADQFPVRVNTPNPTLIPIISESPTESPTATPTLTPTFSPTSSMTPTATYTPTPTRMIDPDQPPQEITVDLPGLPEGAVPLQLVWIPPGKFMMGSPEDEVGRNDDEGPQHEVTISEGFYMGKYEVTNAQYNMFNPNHDNGVLPYESTIDGINNPVVNISWVEAKRYCEWLMNFYPYIMIKLPSEAEWEYACRASTSTRRYWGEDLGDNLLCLYVNGEYQFNTNSPLYYPCTDTFMYSSPVGSFLPNAFGLYDMLGNAAEWCEDDWHNNYNNAPIDGSAWYNELNNIDKVIRYNSFVAAPKWLRSAYRFKLPSNYNSPDIGFRIVVESDEQLFHNPKPNTPFPTSTFTNTLTPTVTNTITPTPTNTFSSTTLQKEFTLDIPNLHPDAKPLEFIWVEPGSFVMGNPENATQEVIISKGYYMSKYEITIGQFNAQSQIFTDPDRLKKIINYPSQPDWQDAVSFCNWISRLHSSFECRLPTEAEWEYVCRAGTTTSFSHGDNDPDCYSIYYGRGQYSKTICPFHSMYVWYSVSEISATREIGLLLPNPWGFHDMHGNVWEFVLDRINPDDFSNTPVVDLIGSLDHDYVIARGGGVDTSIYNCTSFQRYIANQGNAYYTGFRPILTLNDTIAPTESPTATPTLTPTFTPSPSMTPTATYTPTPTRMIDPDQPPQEITVDLPGLPEGAVPLQLVWIPPGKFMMGSPEDEIGRDSDEGPQHEVTISEGFYMGKYEVSNAQYRIFFNKHDSNRLYQDATASPHSLELNTDNQPAASIRYMNAIDFCNKLSTNTHGWTFRLPTEAEWEYACRAGTTTRYSHGDVFDCLSDYPVCEEHDKYIWWKSNADNYSHIVGQKLPNPWGLYDMHGNVNEFCLDNYIENFLSAPNDGSPQQSSSELYVIKGGSWAHWIDECRSAHRRISSQNPILTSGFRIVATKDNDDANNIPIIEITPTPSMTPTATYTTTPTRMIDPDQPPQEITVDLPGLPEGAVPLQLVWIPPGTFMMGSPDDEVGRRPIEGPQHRVDINFSFYIGKFEITSIQYWYFIYSQNYYWRFLYLENQPNNRNINSVMNLPASFIRWFDAIKFCDWLTSNTPNWIFRLPSEAEWEYACRAGTTTRFSFGDHNDCISSDGCSNLYEYLWWKNNSTSQPQLVGLKNPNPFGLYDMHGNLSEWCLDTFHPNYLEAPIDGSAWIEGEINDNSSAVILRGGSFFDSINFCRSASRRIKNNDIFAQSGSGFRVVAQYIGNEKITDHYQVEILLTPTPTPTPPVNIFTEENFPDPYFREMVRFYVLRDYSDHVLSIEPLMFTVQQAAQVKGRWDFDDVPGVGDGDITDLTGSEFFNGICYRVNSYFSIGRCP